MAMAGAEAKKGLIVPPDSRAGVPRQLFAYFPQGNALMNGTIRDVVSSAEAEASHDEEQ